MPVAGKPDNQPVMVTARCVRLPAKVANAASLTPVIETHESLAIITHDSPSLREALPGLSG